MDLLVEIVLDLIAEGLSETSKSAKVPRPIRFIAIGLIVLFSCAVIGLIFLVGYMLLGLRATVHRITKNGTQTSN